MPVAHQTKNKAERLRPSSLSSTGPLGIIKSQGKYYQLALVI